ncbi:MAG: hypothetical protein Q8M92_01730, partial [Candidatus Subteraquimicrobiales bacterium]|nr:hypothetical protein [Candidatus Subteraquimicrobiales bacterium]
MNNQKEYNKALQRFRELQKTKDLDELYDEFDEELLDLQDYILENNSFENPMDRVTAEKIIEHRQRSSLDSHGGYPLWDEVSFKVGKEEYTVIAYGASDENEGEDAIFGMIFVKEDEEDKKLRNKY